MASLRPFKPKNNPFFLLVLDAPNAEEARKNQTAAGSLGEVIEWLMKSSGLSGEYVAINALPARTTDRPTAAQLMEEGRPHVAKAVKKYKPSMVVAMGATAQVACGLSASLSDRKGLLGKVHETTGLGPVGACMSAWMIFREPRIKAKYEMMFAYFAAYAEHEGPPPIPPIEVRYLNTPKDVRRMVRSLERQAERTGRLPTLAYDHETASLVIEYAVLATMSFCSGLRNKKGERVVWLWDYYQGDPFRLGPMPPKWLKIWRRFFMRVDSLYRLIGHNAVAYDDQVVREQFQLPNDSEPGGFAGSSTDTMLVSWALDSTTPNGLKPQAGVMAGYFGYDDGLEPEIKKIVEQRNKYGRQLASSWREVYTPADQHLLDLIGVEPEPVAKKPSAKQAMLDAFTLTWPWPKSVDKKHGAYCLVPHDMLTLYSAYDAAATYDLHKGQQQLVKAYGRQTAVALRLEAAKLLAEGERNGMFIDRELYEQSAADLQDIAANAWASMVAELARSGRDWGTDAPFNPGSPLQVRHIIYGQAEHGWRVDVMRTTEALQARRPQDSRYSIYQLVETWAANLAFDAEYRALCIPDAQARTMDASDVIRALGAQRKFIREKFRYDNGIYPALQQAPLYLAHLTDPTKSKPTLFTKTGLPSLKGAALLGIYEKTQDEFLKYLLVYQRATKLDGTFVSGARKYIRPETGLIHPHYNAIGTATGRISCSAPNEQNRPEPLRGLVVPRHPEWTIVSADLSQAEIRVMAALSGDKALMEALKGEDIHTSVAALMFNIPYAEVTKAQRKAAKTLNFGVLYGMSPHSLAAWLGITAEEAQALMDRYLGRFTRLAAYMEEQRVRAPKPPYEVQTVWGTTISTLDALSYDRSARGHALRVAVNAPVQGTAGELTLWFGVQIRKAVAERGWQDRVKFINTVHDSLTWEVHRSLAQGDPADAAKWTGDFPALVQATFEAPVPVPPLDTVKFEGDIEVGDNWYGYPNAQKAAFSVVDDFDWDSFKLEDMTDEERRDHQNLIEMYWETRAKKK